MNDNPQCPACGNSSKFYTRKKDHEIFRCLMCRTLFVYPDPSLTELSSIYDEQYFFGGGSCGGYTNYDEDKKVMEQAFRSILRLLDEQNGGRGKLLDVGAATGYFVALGQEMGWDATGIEISPYAVEVAKAKNRPVEQGTLLSLHSSAQFDVVTLWDVFEHLTNPGEHLKAVLEILKPGGIFALITPKSDAVWARIVGARWHLLIPPEHVTCYSSSGIRRMLETHGFEVTAIRSVTKRFTLPYIFHIAKNWLGWRWLSSMESFAHSIPRTFAFPVNFHDNMFVIARKL